MTDDEIRELAAGRPIEIVEIDDATIVLTKPSRAEFDRWVDTADKGAANTRHFVESCVLYPPKDEFRALLDRYPAVLRADCLTAVSELAGVGKAKRRTLGP